MLCGRSVDEFYVLKVLYFLCFCLFYLINLFSFIRIFHLMIAFIFNILIEALEKLWLVFVKLIQDRLINLNNDFKGFFFMQMNQVFANQCSKIIDFFNLWILLIHKVFSFLRILYLLINFHCLLDLTHISSFRYHILMQS